MRKVMRKRKRRNDVDETDDDDVTSTLVRRDKNRIYFWCDVDYETCLDLIVQLDAVASSGASVELHINSDGGLVDAAIAVVNKIESLKAHGHVVKTIIDGHAASAATLISVCGSERYICKYASMRIHQLSCGIIGKQSEITDEHTNTKRTSNMLTRIYVKNTKMKKIDVKRLLRRELDMTPSKAIERGLCDAIWT